MRRTGEACPARPIVFYRPAGSRVDGIARSEEYLALNPQGKMPLLVSDEITLPESDTICRYLLDRYRDAAPSFVPGSAASRARSDLLCRIHDMYLTLSLPPSIPPSHPPTEPLSACKPLHSKALSHALHLSGT